MNKAKLINWLREQNRGWQAFLGQIDPALMEQPGVVAHWSMKDLIAHLTGWNRKLVADIQAAGRNEPTPPPPWPEQLQHEDDINAWLYETNRDLSLAEVNAQSHTIFEDLLAVIDGLPDDVRIETVQSQAGTAYYLLHIAEKRFLAGEFFHHYRDDHEPDVLAWLAKQGASSTGD